MFRINRIRLFVRLCLHGRARIKILRNMLIIEISPELARIFPIRSELRFRIPLNL